MAVLSSNVNTQNCILRMLDEHALHKTSLTCKKLRAAANQDRLWVPFLAQRFIEPAENNKHKLTEFFREYCQCHYFHQKTRGLNLAKDLPADRDLFDQYFALRKFVVAYIPQASLDRHLHRWLEPEQLRVLLDSGAKMRLVETVEDPMTTLDEAILEKDDHRLAEIGGLFLKAGSQLTETHDVEGERRFGTLDRAIQKTRSGAFVRMLMDRSGTKLSATVDSEFGRGRGSFDLIFEYWADEFEELVPFVLQKDVRLSETVGDRLGTLDLAVRSHCPWSTIQHLLNAGARITEKTVELAGEHYLLRRGRLHDAEAWRLFKAAAAAQGVVIEEPAVVAREPIVFEPAAAPAAPGETFYAWISSAFDAVVGFLQELGWRIARAVVRCLFGY